MVTLKLRRGTAFEWMATNPVLAPGEIGVDLTNRTIKVGDGVTPWNELPYANLMDTDKSITTTAFRDSLTWLIDHNRLELLKYAFNSTGHGSGANPSELPLNLQSNFLGFNLTTLNPNATGYSGGAFDGRFVYFAIHENDQLARFDTIKEFTSSASWQFFNPTVINPNCKGFAGVLFDGIYLYFIPYLRGSTYHGVVTRYDTRLEFTNPQAWSYFDMTSINSNAKGYIGGVFDGRYIYFSPHNNGSSYSGLVARYDTKDNFNSSSSWTFFDVSTINTNAKGFNGAVFDGRYVYLVPYYTGSAYSGLVARYDTTLSFSLSTSWTFFNMTTVNSNAKGYHKATFDGRYIYFSPMYNENGFHGLVARYDTVGSFTVSSSWSVFDLTALDTNLRGFNGAAFDGRYVYFIPYKLNSTTYHGRLVRYDTAHAFSLQSSWTSFNIEDLYSGSKGFGGAVFDGRYIYLVPQASSLGTVTRVRGWVGGFNDIFSLYRIARNRNFFIANNGYIGVGLMTPSYQLHLSQDSAAKPSTNTWTISSDIRLKKDIQLADLDRCYEIVKRIPLKYFRWKEEVYTKDQVPDRGKLGWIADDVEPVFPKAITIQEKFELATEHEEEVEELQPVTDENGDVVFDEEGNPKQELIKVKRMVKDTLENVKSLNADQIYAALFGAVQKLIQKVEKLEAMIVGELR